LAIARANKHEIIELSHILYLKEARRKYGAGKIPRNCPERVQYEQEISRRVENKLGREPDLICLAGFDLWNTDWMIDKYYPRIINVHPGDMTKAYEGLHWMPSAKAIIAGDESLRSTLFIADKSEDKGPILMQSKPLNIIRTLSELESQGEKGLTAGLNVSLILLSSTILLLMMISGPRPMRKCRKRWVISVSVCRMPSKCRAIGKYIPLPSTI